MEPLPEVSHATERESWSPPFEGSEVRSDRTDVRTGGAETSRCGPVGDLKWRMDVAYHRVEPGRHICFTETLWEGEILLTVAQSTFEISTASEGCRLRLTDQVASYIGREGIDGHKAGYARALKNLAAMLVPA